jgi:hypothetical protein
MRLNAGMRLYFERDERSRNVATFESSLIVVLIQITTLNEDRSNQVSYVNTFFKFTPPIIRSAAKA